MAQFLSLKIHGSCVINLLCPKALVTTIWTFGSWNPIGRGLYAKRRSWAWHRVSSESRLAKDRLLVSSQTQKVSHHYHQIRDITCICSRNSTTVSSSGHRCYNDCHVIIVSLILHQLLIQYEQQPFFALHGPSTPQPSLIAAICESKGGPVHQFVRDACFAPGRINSLK